MTDMRPPFKYFGSKVSMAKWIIERLPEHEHFVEVCAGSASVLLAKPAVPLETLNDLNGEVVNFFRVVRDPSQREALIEAVAFTPYARSVAADARGRRDDVTGDEVERALDFLIRMNLPVVPDRAGWQFVSSAKSARGQRTARWEALPDTIAMVGLRLARVQIDQIDMVTCVERYDKPGSLLFIDPPYHPDSRPGSTVTYHTEAIEADHARLMDAVGSVKHASVAITHYPHPLYDALGWEHEDYASYRNRANRQTEGERSEATERLYLLRQAA